MAYIKPTDRKKAWAVRQNTEKRPTRDLTLRNLFRIYCEGENTEPEYFKSFAVNTETKVDAIGLARSKTALVTKAIELLTQEAMLEGMDEYDEDRQLWVVFDYDKRDDVNEAKDFNDAIELAHRHKINVAYSNDSFELWFVLHYQYLTSAITRNEYYHILSDKLNLNYEKDGKGKAFAQSLYHIFLPMQAVAIQNAKRLHQSKEEDTPSSQNPCTTVYKLVEELNKCLKK